MILRQPSPVPHGGTILDYLAGRRKPLIEALTTPLTIPTRDGTHLGLRALLQRPALRPARTGSRWAGPVAGCRTPGGTQ